MTRFSRSSSEGFLVLYVGPREECPEITIPTDEVAYAYALQSGSDWPRVSARAMEQREPRGLFDGVRPSDKGRYLTGTLRLFGGLQAARAFLLHDYWRSVFAELGGGAGSARHDEIKRVLKKQVSEGRIEDERAWDRLAGIVAKEARRVRMPTAKMSFAGLRSRHEPYVERERQRFPGQEAAQVQDRVGVAQQSLSDSIRSLCARSVLYQGYEWRCETCFHANWNPIGALQAAPTCEVCGESALAPVDQPWDFRLHGFVREALKEHGVLALVWCLVQMEGRARDSFFFLGPQDLFADYAGNGQLSHREADLLCVVDRRVHLCEVKSSGRDIDIESLIAVAKRMSPDVVTLAVMEPRSSRLEGKLSELQGALQEWGVPAELVTLSGNAFETDGYLPT